MCQRHIIIASERMPPVTSVIMAKNPTDFSADNLNLGQTNGLDHLLYEIETTDTSSVGLVLR